MSNRLINNKKLINEWNHNKNIGLDIEKITTGSHIRVWDELDSTLIKKSLFRKVFFYLL